MKGSPVKRTMRSAIILSAVFCALVVLPMLSKARSSSSSTTAITVVNNSSREISHVYLSPTDEDRWGADQLGGSGIAAGASTTLNVACDGAAIKVIAEDQNGCFLSQVVTCGESSNWTITNDATPNCGN